MVKPDRAYPIKEMVQRCINEYRNSTAFSADLGNRSVTYGELGDLIKKLVGKFYELGFANQNVVLLGKNSYEYAITFFAAMSSSICLVPVDPSLSSDEIIERIRFSDAKFVLWDEGAFQEMVRKSCPEIVFCDLKSLFNEAVNSTDRGFDVNSEVLPDTQVSLMLFSSGTGGRMKLARIAQISLFTEWNVVKNYEKVADNALIIAPLFHILAIGDLIGNFYMGKSIYISQGFSFTLKELEYVRPKCLRMVPATADWILHLIMDKNVEEGRKILGGNLKNIRTSGAPLEEKLIKGLKEYGITVVSDYGMTEATGPVSVAVAKGDTLDVPIGTVGRVIDGLTVTVERADGAEYGEIIISGSPVFAGYYKDDEATNEALWGGGFHTGDLGFMDEEGFLHIVGRKKNVIILSHGENVIPEIIEKKLLENRLIRDCIVFKDGDGLSANIVIDEKSDNNENAVRDYIKLYNRENPTYRQISKVYFVNELERTGSGKMKR